MRKDKNIDWDYFWVYLDHNTEWLEYEAAQWNRVAQRHHSEVILGEPSIAGENITQGRISQSKTKKFKIKKK